MRIHLNIICVVLSINFLDASTKVKQFEPSKPSMYPSFPACKIKRHNEMCDGKYVQFFLHTREGSEPVSVTDNCNNITETSNFANRPNIIVVHGYNSDMGLDSLVGIRNEYLKSGDYNVWAVDYPLLVKDPCYPFAVFNVGYVGRCASLLVQALRDVQEDPFVHAIGFSLGAHVAGRLGFELRNRQIDRITGLDPALPLFFNFYEGERLSPTDAKFVDVIHTNMFMQGHWSALGHVDFYMNGGSIQPGCTQPYLNERSGCDHYRSTEYFLESINSLRGFYGVKCPGLLNVVLNRCMNTAPLELMGRNVSLKARGQYYVTTGDKSPYALGQPSSPVGNTIELRRTG